MGVTAKAGWDSGLNLINGIVSGPRHASLHLLSRAFLSDFIC
jgi:hypothetical protein